MPKSCPRNFEANLIELFESLIARFRITERLLWGPRRHLRTASRLRICKSAWWISATAFEELSFSSSKFLSLVIVSFISCNRSSIKRIESNSIGYNCCQLLPLQKPGNTNQTCIKEHYFQATTEQGTTSTTPCYTKGDRLQYHTTTTNGMSDVP